MAENDKTDPSRQPPKVNLKKKNGNGLPKPDSGLIEGLPEVPPEDTTRIDLPDERPPLPKVVKSAKSETARIQLADAKPPTAKIKAGEDTTRVDLPDSKPDTARIDLAAARPAETTAVAPSGDTQRIAADNPNKADTFRIDLDEATPVDTSAPSSEAETRGLPELSEEERERILMQSTMRVQLDPVAEQPAVDETVVPPEPAPTFDSEDTTVALSLTDEEREEILKQSTMRVQLEDGAVEPSDTEPIPPADAGPAARNQTMRVQVEDAGKGDTARLGADTMPIASAAGGIAAGASSRIEIEEAGAADEDVFKRHGGEAAAAPQGKSAVKVTRPGTVVMKKPPQIPAPEPAAGGEADKGKTARIEMPTEAPKSARPKTIKIKRADSTVTRVGAAAKPDVKRAPKSAAAGDIGDVGTLYSVLVLVSVVLVGALLYVLIAQTLAPGLPFPGKIAG